MTKRTGRLLRSKVITGTPEHAIAGHERMDCDSCHSRTVVQCYGCHTTYDRTKTSWDFIKEEITDGSFSETEDYRMLYPFPLALDQRGRISPVTPGCQTFITVIDGNGRTVLREHVSRYKGKPQLRFAPFHPHNTGEKAVGCSACHGNPAFLGFGQHVLEGGSIRGTFPCEKDDWKALDGFLSLRQTARLNLSVVNPAHAPTTEITVTPDMIAFEEITSFVVVDSSHTEAHVE